LPREVNDVGVVGSPSSLSGCIIPSSVEGNGYSQTQDLLVDFDHNWEIDDWKKADELWERVSAEWVVNEDQGEKFRAIWGEMIERQKNKKKRELRNL